MAQNKISRSLMNRLYLHFSRSRQAAFHARFAKLFRNREARVQDGYWIIEFRGRRIEVPLNRDSMWLDWDNALSILGHETEIKHTYETLLDEVPDLGCVFDVGANYGMHSLLFLTQGVRVVSFEPNPVCHSYIKRLEAINDVRFTLESIALGSQDGRVELCFPEREVWLGTTDSNRAHHLSSRFTLQRAQVACGTIDDYVEKHGCAPDLIKIDTEGSELGVLHGARRTLERTRPILILESWKDESREGLWRYVSGFGYATVTLPIVGLDKVEPLPLRAFTSSDDSNFAALPMDRFGPSAA